MTEEAEVAQTYPTGFVNYRPPKAGAYLLKIAGVPEPTLVWVSWLGTNKWWLVEYEYNNGMPIKMIGRPLTEIDSTAAWFGPLPPWPEYYER